MKILLSGILVLLLGSLIVYSYLFREDISRFLKNKESGEVSNNFKTDRVILSPEMNSEPPLSPNDLNSLPTKDLGSEESSVNEKDFPSKENKIPQEGERSEERKTQTPKDKLPEEKWTKDETRAIQDYPVEKMKDIRDEREKKSDLEVQSRHIKKKTKMKKRSSLKTGKRIRSLETRVDRLEKKLGISNIKKKHKTDRRSLEKRVRKLEKEMERLKSKE
ncbi:hypothetical protein [Leptospira santarosai]|uniref:hypothetical protein n=1 Tax=Leptospira santarosai TaxID=28183 RepID=UPI00069B182D